MTTAVRMMLVLVESRWIIMSFVEQLLSCFSSPNVVWDLMLLL